ncbi:asparaginase [Melghirimyces profundicolus]|uniref:asparaginase n=1 Tax=Melghirimyces profundicolus TaxID=1242148 RepID=A0A2T6BUX6_9BACL|nr:asparaginase [Melghirimyces profundicolus]PTX59878.1 asparaginase [Melghirimyces profundicolus]
MKRIAVITTGGTIAMAEDEKTHSLKPKGSEALQSVLPVVSRHAQVEMDHFCNLPSPHITPEWMYRIGERVTSHLQRDEIDGVVVTHGTDTLEETAFFLDLTVPGEKPVVVTGAMRSQNELGADGPLNLVNAVRTAAHPGAWGKGTLVVFNDEIHAARQVTKTHTSNVATFRSPAQGPIGSLTKKDLVFHQSLKRSRLFPQLPPTDRIHLIKAAAGTDDLFIRAALDSGTNGLVLEALGQGNLPPAMLPALKEALDRGIPAVLVSRCYNGFVEDSYGYKGGGKQLKDWGMIFSNGLNGQKARIQLMVALHVSREPAVLQSFFSEHYDEQ